MYPFFNPGAVNTTGNNQPSAPMQQQQPPMMNPSNFPQNPTQFQQLLQQPMMNPSNFPQNPTQLPQSPQMPAPSNFQASPFQQTPMNFNHITQNPAQLLNHNLLLALGLGLVNQMQQGVNPFLQPMTMTMPMFNGQGTPGTGTSGNVSMPQNSMMGFGYNSGRPHLPMNSNVPNQMQNNSQQALPMTSNVPNQLLMTSNVPNQMQNNSQQTLPMNSNVPNQLPMNSNVPNQMQNNSQQALPMNSNVPNQLPMNSNVPNQLPMNSNVPNQMQNTSQQGIRGQVFASIPIQNSLQNGYQHGVTGQPQGNNTNAPQGLNNQLGGSRPNNFVRNTNQQGYHNGFNNHLGNRSPNFQKFQTKGGNIDGRKPPFAKNVKSPQAVKRSFPLNYTEEEIKQWREARQKNHPSAANIEKLKEKKKDPEISKKEAALRCQQLKEILAKQAELGCEVAEIPPSYLSVPGADSGRAFNENDRRVRFKQNNENFHNNRRPWKQNDRGPYGHNPYNNHRQNNHFSKKPWQMNGDSWSRDEGNKNKETLLKRLHETDIRRVKRHLLQVFRTMVMNSFFKDWPEKPLKFPQVVVREIGNEEGILGETVEAVDQYSCTNVVASVDEVKQEEGEITD